MVGCVAGVVVLALVVVRGRRYLQDRTVAVGPNKRKGWQLSRQESFYKDNGGSGLDTMMPKGLSNVVPTVSPNRFGDGTVQEVPLDRWDGDIPTPDMARVLQRGLPLPPDEDIGNEATGWETKSDDGNPTLGVDANASPSPAVATAASSTLTPTNTDSRATSPNLLSPNMDKPGKGRASPKTKLSSASRRSPKKSSPLKSPKPTNGTKASSGKTADGAALPPPGPTVDAAAAMAAGVTEPGLQSPPLPDDLLRMVSPTSVALRKTVRRRKSGVLASSPAGSEASGVTPKQPSP